MKFEPKDRETPEKLLDYDFITKHENSKPSIGRWVHNEFVLKKKEEKEKKN
jgi:hypothetical protein